MTKNSLYTGIGSRIISDDEEEYITALSSCLDEAGMTVVSGNANGSDIAFQRGVKHLAILPWKGFNYDSFMPDRSLVLDDDDEEAYGSVKFYHPAPGRLSQGAFKLMARNYRQIRCTPVNSKFVLFCADGGNDIKKIKGGTSQAVRIADDFKIPYMNIRVARYKLSPAQLANYMLDLTKPTSS